MSDTTPRSTSKALSYFSTLVCAQVGRPDCPEERSQKVCGIYVLTDGDCSLDCPKLHPRDVAGHLALKKAQEYKGMRNPQCTVHDLLTGSGLTLAFPVAVCLKGDSCFHKAACWFSHAKDVRGESKCQKFPVHGRGGQSSLHHLSSGSMNSSIPVLFWSLVSFSVCLPS